MDGISSKKYSSLGCNLYKIPIEEYKEDIDTELANEKKKEILNLLKNFNKLRSEDEFNEIKYKLHIACRKGDVDLIKIFLCTTIDSGIFKFKIDEANQTASLFRFIKNEKKVIIPRTVEHESIEYLITSIIDINDEIKTLKFARDSAVKTIYGNYFST